MFWEFKTTKEFKTLINRHLLHHLNDWGKSWGIQEKSKTETKNKEEEAEKKIYFSKDDGYFDIVEKAMSAGQKSTDSINRIHEHIKTYVNRLNEEKKVTCFPLSKRMRHG